MNAQIRIKTKNEATRQEGWRVKRSVRMDLRRPGNVSVKYRLWYR